jgi:hypothetical protein
MTPTRTIHLPHLCMEFGEKSGRCRACNTKTVLVTAANWHTHPKAGPDEFVEPHGEISGSYCPKCQTLTALFLHGL